ncbi:carbonic anhydrase 7 [Bombyx mandarina]|uniref:Alpha-carbonic anhydrase domain-containing protein n=2 Tax=Bombyx TaxID=7090 RepID=A0A8R2AKQ6_BOMMO|nr:carbonic anhydrase 7 [Bombyx mori]XP_028036153.1 carbonic anhydrase 7 [Bombyx mandarina]
MKYFGIIAVFTLVVINVSVAAGWGYRASDQRRWAVLHPACGGRQQSPIAISARQAIPISIPAIELIGYQNPLPGPLTITNTGHSVALTIPKYTSEEEKKGFRLPYIFGGPLDNEYEIDGLHFHWGDKNNRGSEHTLNDMRLPLEMHIIHRNKKYRNTAEAMQHPDGLCVLAFFYQVVEFDAKLLSPIVKNLTAIENFNSTLQLPHTFSLSSILSGLDTERFYTYKGSLTTPPCAEAVTWVIFSDYLPISVFQMDNFRGLLSNLNLPLVDNFRQLQPLFGRRVFVRITSKNPKFKKTKLHYSKWDWVGHKKSENDVIDFDE